ncbi:unnamed protein product [Microthlaspi erraticum]|uniref:Uncharacterized protein n=1 Tax=Microthlaspi erraticum TaxID=1685480 RepID=A0A6D2L0G0_9BRAS|nr:unnamed protein product [Microthlaspi erraticum]
MPIHTYQAYKYTRMDGVTDASSLPEKVLLSSLITHLFSSFHAGDTSLGHRLKLACFRCLSYRKRSDSETSPYGYGVHETGENRRTCLGFGGVYVQEQLLCSFVT